MKKYKNKLSSSRITTPGRESALGSSTDKSLVPGSSRIDPKKVLKALTEYVNDTDLNRRRILQLDRRFTGLDEFYRFKAFVEEDEERKQAIADINKQIR